MDDRLRREVGFLATRLGSIVREQAGEKVFATIERLRGLSKQLRTEPATTASPDAVLSGLSVPEASAVAHAFSLFFHLVNLCEERQRVRRLREYGRAARGAPISLRHTFARLEDAGRRTDAEAASLGRFLRSVHIEPVMTAHPTEAKRRSVINHLLRIRRELDALDGGLGAEAEVAVNPWVEALWLTD